MQKLDPHVARLTQHVRLSSCGRSAVECARTRAVPRNAGKPQLAQNQRVTRRRNHGAIYQVLDPADDGPSRGEFRAPRRAFGQGTFPVEIPCPRERFPCGEFTEKRKDRIKRRIHCAEPPGVIASLSSCALYRASRRDR